jgi:SAM-dependent methyltransferase
VLTGLQQTGTTTNEYERRSAAARRRQTSIPLTVCSSVVATARLRLSRLLSHPVTRGLELDDPRLTALRVEVIQQKPFLRRIYSEWYQLIRSRIPDGAGAVLELGSGGGYFRQFVPHIIRSDVFLGSNLDLVTDARHLPFGPNRLKAITMTDVFHHVPKPEAFLREAIDCLRPGGRIIMIEPWVCRWSTLIYRHLHHEPFLPEAESWDFPETGPLSGANGALPWIVFVRDRQTFIRKFPELEIEEIRPMMPVRYLLSGGVSLRDIVPSVTYTAWQRLETALSNWNETLGMFALFSLRRL